MREEHIFTLNPILRVNIRVAANLNIRVAANWIQANIPCEDWIQGKFSRGPQVHATIEISYKILY